MTRIWTMHSLTIVFFLIISVCCVKGGTNVHENKQSLRKSRDKDEINFKMNIVKTKIKKLGYNMTELKEYKLLLTSFEEKLNFCLTMKAKTTTVIRETTTEAISETTKEQTKWPITTAEETFETTESLIPTTEDYVETENVQKTDVSTKTFVRTTKDYFETTEVHTRRPTTTAEKPIVITEDYNEVPTTKSVITTEEYIEPTKKPVKTTEEYFEPTEKQVMTTEDYPEITETSKKTLSTIVDYPEDKTNYPTLPPTEIPIETTKTTMEPWIEITSSIGTTPWWITSTKRDETTQSKIKTRSTSSRKTRKPRTKTKRPRTRSKRSRPTGGFRTWTVKKFTVKTMARFSRN